MTFSREQYNAAAVQLGCEPEMIEAVCAKEVDGKNLTFSQGGRQIPKILYEKHVMWDLLEKANISPRDVLRDNPSLGDVLGQTPYRSYGRYIKQYSKRERAMQIHRDAAFGACSYTGFQIMGYHHAACGYESAEAFGEAMADADQHIPAFVAFIRSEKLEKFLQTRDFEGFAKRYNGPDYWRKGYHIELARIYQRILARNLPKHESAVTAVVQSGTIQRGAAIVAAGAAPATALLPESDNIGQILDTVKTITDQGQQINDQVGDLQIQAESLAPILDWLPWAVGGWTVLLVLIFAALIQRYLRDRGYIQ